MSNANDTINLTTAQEATQLAFAVLDQLQGIEPESLRVPATAIMLVLLCRRLGLNISDILDKADRMIRDAILEGKGEHVRAIQQYLKEEMK